MENETAFKINGVEICSYGYDSGHEKVLFYDAYQRLTAEISLTKAQWDSLCQANSTLEDMWETLANMFGDAEELVPHPCPVCGEIPEIEYACGEYFIDGKEGCRLCGEFSEMHASKDKEIDAWNKAADAEAQFECPLGGDETNDCADCVYGGEYHLIDGECVERK